MLWCSPCQRSRRDYNPRHDPNFIDQLLALFIAHEGQRISPQDELCISPLFRKAIQDGIRSLRRQGHVIEAVERRRGYTYLGRSIENRP